MTFSLRQFRDRYPYGCLTSELVQAGEEQFIVRSLIHLEGQLVASGMAADPSLEAAEDRAQQRALATLGLDDSPLESAPNPAKRPVKTSPATPTGTPLASVTRPAPPPLAPVDILADPLPVEDEADGAPWPEAALPNPPLTAIAATSVAPAVKGEKVESPVSIAANLPPPAPVDLSDVIAQTDVELQRLGWSVGAGRDYLEKTYGKRSRHDLSDEELLGFLLYLESLESPAEA